jgi:hypothetical protein
MTNEELLKVIERVKASGEPSLNLSNRGLTTLPPEIGQLANLTHLNLGDNQLTELPLAICRLTKLEKLDLWNNKLTALPPEIRQLTNLRELNLSGNKFNPILPGISQLRNLTYLNLSWNQFTELPSAICQLTQLDVLDLWGNELAKLPQDIGQLTALRKLNLGHNQLSSLPSELFQLTGLTELNLSRNELNTLPPELFQMTKLVRLDLNDNKLTALPPEISQLTCLEKLNLWDNQLTALPPEIGQLKNLTDLPLYNNQLTSLPPEIGQLTSLTELALTRNQLAALPTEICQLTKLRTLNLYRNKLTTLPQEICQLTSLTNLYINGNKLTDPPLEVAKQGIWAISQYFAELEKGKQPLNEVKIILVGEGSAGKTSLVKRLLNQSFDDNENTTHGISINSLTVETGTQQIKVNIWDFGGQEIQHATHQFFLSKRSLYVLVLDGRKEERPEHWLRYIEAFGGDSPVLVVLNKYDTNPSFDVNKAFLLEKYPSIRGVFQTSCKTKKGIAWFKEALLEEVAKVEMIGIRWPKSWFAVKYRLEQMGKPYISAEEYGSICAEAGIVNEASREALVDFLHDLGVAVHFKDFGLDKMHVLTPEWVTKGVYAIITDEKMAGSKGVLPLHILKELLKEQAGKTTECLNTGKGKASKEKNRYPEETHSYLTELMQKFELCYELDKESVLIPQLLPVLEPTFDFDYSGSLRFALYYPDFLPPSVFPRFMVKVHKDIKNDLRWRTGVVLEDKQNGVCAVIKADIEARRINIWVSGKYRRDYLHYFRYLLTDINSSFEKLSVGERVPMPDDPHVSADYETLLNYAEQGSDVYFAEGSKKRYSVHELIGLVQPKDKDELAAIPDKMGLKADDKASWLDMFNNLFELKPSLLGITVNLHGFFKELLAREKQKRRASRK